MMARRGRLFWLAALALLLLLPGRAWACACCSNAGDYYVGLGRPDAFRVNLMKEMRFGGTAQLYLTEADMEEDTKGLAHRAERYAVSGSLVGGAWKLTFRDGNKSGTLSLPLPVRMSSYAADIRDGQTSPGGGPLLYKEWRFEGPVRGTGLFQPGVAAPARYVLVLQGRGNACENSEDFTHWRLQVTGRRADYAFYGELSNPNRPSAQWRSAAGKN